MGRNGAVRRWHNLRGLGFEWIAHWSGHVLVMIVCSMLLLKGWITAPVELNEKFVCCWLQFIKYWSEYGLQGLPGQLPTRTDHMFMTILIYLSNATTTLLYWPDTGVSEIAHSVSCLRLPIRYPGINGGRRNAISRPQFGPSTPPLSLWTA